MNTSGAEFISSRPVAVVAGLTRRFTAGREDACYGATLSLAANDRGSTFSFTIPARFLSAAPNDLHTRSPTGTPARRLTPE